MPEKTSCYAALILPDACGLEAEPYVAAAYDAIAACDTTPETPPLIAPEGSVVCGDTIRLQIEPQEDSDFGPRILITASATPNARFSEARAARVLSDTVLGALEFSDADIIEWFAPDTLLDTEDFVRLRSYVSPRRNGTHPSEFEDDDSCDEEDEDWIAAHSVPKSQQTAWLRHAHPEGIALEAPSQLTDRLMDRCENLRDTDGADLRLNAANWAMTGTVACISPPMGASMTVLGLGRGLDFRRVTQVLTLTALFVLLQNQGVIEQVMQMFQR